MKNEKIANIANKVGAAAATFIGTAFIINGINYFIPQLEYHVPRILLPVFHMLGHIGLAVGLLILGLALIGYGFYKWRKLEGKTGIFIIILTVSAATFILLNSLSGKEPNKSSDEYFEEQEEKRSSAIEEMKQTDRPKFKSSEANAYFDEFESLITAHKKHIEDENNEALKDDQAKYEALLMKSPTAISNLSSDDKYLFSQYNAKLMIMWSDLKEE